MKPCLLLLLALLACQAPAPRTESAPPAPSERPTATSSDGPQVIHTQDGGRMEGLLRNGKREGPWVAYGPGGGIRSRAVYQEGLEEGPIEVFHENGLTYYTGQYHKGITVGEWIFFDPQGKEVKRVRYDSTGTELKPAGR